jgi:hypothetical protein
VVCLLCARFTATYYWLQLRLLDARAVTGLWRDKVAKQVWRGTLLGQSHCNAIESENGYTERDMLPVWKPTDGPWTGIVQPMRAFRANDYIPGECVAPIDLSSNRTAAPQPDADAQQQPHALSCFYERTAADFL